MRYKIEHNHINWNDHIVEHPNRFRKVTNDDGTITLKPEEGKTFQEGTPVNAENLNKMDIKIGELVDAANEHGDKIISLAVEVATLKGSLLNNFDSNIFIKTFDNIDDVNVVGGVWDRPNSRIVV